MKHVEIYVRYIVALLGIAYPIILQVISKLDDKYCSVTICQLFEQEPQHKWYKRILIIAIGASILWTLDILLEDSILTRNLINILAMSWTLDIPLQGLVLIQYLLVNFSGCFVIISTIALIATFFLLVDRIMIYYNPRKLAQYLIDKYTRGNDER